MKKAVCLLAALVLAAVLSGCGLIRIEEEERKPVDYTVVERQDIPAALDEIMNEKKEKEAKPYRVVPGHDGCSFVLCNAGNPQHFSSRYL